MITNADIERAQPLSERITELLMRARTAPATEHAAALALVLGVVCDVHDIDIDDVVHLMRGTAGISHETNPTPLRIVRES